MPNKRLQSLRTIRALIATAALAFMAGCADDNTPATPDPLDVRAQEQAAEIAELNARLDKMTAAMEQLAAAPTPSSAESPSPARVAVVDIVPSAASAPVPAAPTALAPGPIIDVYLMDDAPDLPLVDDTGDGVTVLEHLDIPESMAAGSMIAADPIGRYDVFMEDPSLRQLSSHTVGVRSSGFLNLTEAGPYLFVLTLETKEHYPEAKGRKYPQCSIHFRLSERDVVDLVAGAPARGQRMSIRDTSRISKYLKGKPSPEGFLGAYDSRHQKYMKIYAGEWTRTGTVNIREPGLYPAEIWVACSSVDPRQIISRLKIRGPADRAVRGVTVDDFLHSE